MGACYKCGGDGWISKVTAFGVGPVTKVPVRNGNTHDLGRQFTHRLKTLCPVCQGRGVPVEWVGNYPRNYSGA